MNYMEEYNNWLNSSIFDEETKKELESISQNEKEIEDRFYKSLTFGTAGLRGVMGSGTNRMNKYTVMKATQGIANYIISLLDDNNLYKGKKPSVVIAFDSRNNSYEYAHFVSECLAGNKIESYIFESLRPTPELSFAIRHLGCIIGINITASHNPKEYNGYKVYFEDGAQITPPHDKNIMDMVNSIKDYNSIKGMDFNEGKKCGLIKEIGKDVDEAYYKEVLNASLNSEVSIKHGKDIKIVYTPIHGTGNIPVNEVLNRAGFTSVCTIKEQALPDGNFSTVSYPNPESPNVYELALKKARETGADIIIATDPDADRLGAYIKDDKGEYYHINGNVSGSLICYYVLEQMKEKGILPEDGYIVKSFVTTNMARDIASLFNVETKEVLTGFKYIGLEILNSEITKKGTYLFGFEESYGCLKGTYARDKDAVSASLFLCEALAYYKEKGKTLHEVLKDIYEKLGYYYEDVVSISLPGKEGEEKIIKIMKTIVEKPFNSLGNKKVLYIRDYNLLTRIDLKNKKEEKINTPSTNAIYYEMEDGSWVAIRPSGTEPKVKFYIGVKEKTLEESKKLINQIKIEIDNFIKGF